MKSQNNFLLFLLMGTVVVLSNIIIVLKFNLYTQPVPTNKVNTALTPIQNTTDISSWQVYDSTLFTFRYPRELGLQNTRNSVLIADGPTNQKSTSYYFGLRKNSSHSDIGSTFQKTIDGKPAYLRKIVVSNQNYPDDNIWQLSIEGIDYFSDGKWQKNGNLFIDIHIDEGFLDADKISNQIFDTITFRKLANKNDSIVIKVDSLNIEIPYKWWYSCRQFIPDSWINQNLYKSDVTHTYCSIDTRSNTDPHQPAQFALEFYPNKNDVLTFFDNKILNPTTQKKAIPLNYAGELTQGVLDPKKFLGSAAYAQGEHVSQLKIVTMGGLYIFNGATTTTQQKSMFNQILSTIKISK